MDFLLHQSFTWSFRIKRAGTGVLVYFIWIVALTVATAQSPADLDKIREVTVNIHADSSTLKINGTTNVNTFTCIYRGGLNLPEIDLKVTPTDSTKLLNGAQLKLKVEQFNCGKKKMNEDFYAFLQSKKNPYIYLDVAELWNNSTIDSTGNIPDFYTQTIFTIAGVTNKYRVASTYDAKNGEFMAQGTHKLDITEFGLEPPKKFLGLVKVDKIVEVEFTLLLSLNRHHNGNENTSR